jgi:hypothetical protein
MPNDWQNKLANGGTDDNIIREKQIKLDGVSKLSTLIEPAVATNYVPTSSSSNAFDDSHGIEINWWYRVYQFGRIC